MNKLLLILLLPCSLSVSAQNNVPPGDQRIMYDKLKSFTATYEMKRGGQYWATAVISMDSIMVDGKRAFRHSYEMQFDGQTVFDETIFLQESMAPLLKFIHGGLGPDLAYKVYAYKDNRVVGSNNFADGRYVEPIDTTYENSAYFGAGMAYLATALLKTDTGRSFQITSALDDMIDTATWTLTSQEGGTMLYTDAKGNKEFLIDKPPYLVKKEFPQFEVEWVLK